MVGESLLIFRRSTSFEIVFLFYSKYFIAYKKIKGKLSRLFSDFSKINIESKISDIVLNFAKSKKIYFRKN